MAVPEKQLRDVHLANRALTAFDSLVPVGEAGERVYSAFAARGIRGLDAIQATLQTAFSDPADLRRTYLPSGEERLVLTRRDLPPENHSEIPGQPSVVPVREVITFDEEGYVREMRIDREGSIIPSSISRFTYGDEINGARMVTKIENLVADNTGEYTIVDRIVVESSPGIFVPEFVNWYGGDTDMQRFYPDAFNTPSALQKVGDLRGEIDLVKIKQNPSLQILSDDQATGKAQVLIYRFTWHQGWPAYLVDINRSPDGNWRVGDFKIIRQFRGVDPEDWSSSDSSTISSFYNAAGEVVSQQYETNGVLDYKDDYQAVSPITVDGVPIPFYDVRRAYNYARLTPASTNPRIYNFVNDIVKGSNPAIFSARVYPGVVVRDSIDYTQMGSISSTQKIPVDYDVEFTRTISGYSGVPGGKDLIIRLHQDIMGNITIVNDANGNPDIHIVP